MPPVVDSATVSDDAPCGCDIGTDGLARALCVEHGNRARYNEYRMREGLDQELDAVVRELAGRSPTRIERKPGATGTFAIARQPP